MYKRLALLFFCCLIFAACTAKKPEEKAGQGNIKILWLEEGCGDCYIINTDYLKDAPEQVRAILAYISTKGGTACQYNKNDEIVCDLTSALSLGAQGSDKHVAFIKRWLKVPNQIYTIPYTATFQQIFRSIDLVPGENGKVVFLYTLDAFSCREGEKCVVVKIREEFKYTDKKVVKVSEKELERSEYTTKY